MKKQTPVIVAVSGGFDPLHVGHIRLFREARALGDKLIVILNNDNWIRLKKGRPFMPQEERKEILEALEMVDEVVLTDHEPGTNDYSISSTLEQLRPDIFANGGDRKSEKDIPENIVCGQIGCKMAFNIGHGGKVQSSSWLIKNSSQDGSHPCACGSTRMYNQCHGSPV